MPEWFWFVLVLLALWPWCLYPVVLLFFPKKTFPPASFESAESVLRICLNGVPRQEWIQIWNQALDRLPSLWLEIGLDGDHRGEWCQSFSCPERVRIQIFAPKTGKSVILNALARQDEMKSGLLYLADADTRFQPEDLLRLAEALGGEIGLVAAEVEYEGEDHFEARYIRKENRLRREENARGFHAGLSGALMCLRAADFEPLQPGCPSDMELCLQLICRKKASIALPDVRVFESLSQRNLTQRRTRTLIRGLHCVLLYLPRLIRTGAFKTAFSLLFRKLWRWLSPAFLLLAFLCAWQTSHPAVFSIGTFLVLLGLIGPSRGIYLMQAWVLALWDFLRGRSHVAW